MAKYESGDVDINTLTITPISGGQAQGILPQTISVSIFEDFIAPALYCEVLINDSIGMLKTLPIIGQEYLDIDFQTPQRANYKARFHIYQVADYRSDPLQQKAVYCLKGISQERIADSVGTVEKGYQQPIHSIVQDILQTSLNTTKKLFYEETKGVQQITFTRQSPFDAITMLRKRACSMKNQSSSFVFFENKYGFNFSTIENLMATNQSNIGDKIFIRYTATANIHQNPLNFRQIVAATTANQYNMLGALGAGALNIEHNTFDLLKKTIKTNKYRLPDFNQFSTPDAQGAVSPFTSTLNSMYGDSPALRLFNIEDSSKPDTFINDFMVDKLGFLATHLHGSVDIHVNGDSSVTIGDVITIQVPKVDGLTSSTIQPEPLTNGNFLVAKAHHYIQISAMKPKYTQSLNLMKGTYVQ